MEMGIGFIIGQNDDVLYIFRLSLIIVHIFFVKDGGTYEIGITFDYWKGYKKFSKIW